MGYEPNATTVAELRPKRQPVDTAYDDINSINIFGDSTVENHCLPRLRRRSNWPECDVLILCGSRPLTLRRETFRPDSVLDLRVSAGLRT